MRLEFSNSCFFPRVLLRKGNIVSLSVTASFSRLFRTLIFFRPQRLRAFALHSTAENAPHASTATEKDKHPSKKKRSRYSYFAGGHFPFGSLAALSPLPVLARFYDDAQRHEGAASEPEKTTDQLRRWHACC